MSAYTCPGCIENNMVEECWHTAEMWALAEGIRDGVERQYPDPPHGWEPGSVAGAWAFVDDTDGLVGDIGEPPYRVTMMHPDGKSDVDSVGVINGRHLFVARSGDSGGWMEYLGDLGDFLTVREPDDVVPDGAS